MTSFIYILFTIFISNIITNLLPYSYYNLSMFFPMFIVISLIIIYFLMKNKYIYIVSCTIIGIITDFLYNPFFINSYIFLFISLIIILFYNKRNLNIINLIICSLIVLVLYDTTFFFSLVVSNYGNYTINDLLYKISCSIFINIIYIILSYLVLNKSLKKAEKH